MLQQLTSSATTTQTHRSNAISNSLFDKCFMLFCGLHLFLWTVAATLFRSTVPFDTAEGFAWGSQWQWGYDKHPLLAPWLTALFADVGGGVGFATYLLSQISVVVAFICIYLFAKKIMPVALAFISVLLLEAIDFYTFASTKFDPDVLTLAIWALSILCFYNALVKPNYWRWVLVGVTAALAILSKYTSALLLLSMLMVLLATPEGRNQWRKPYIYAALVGFVLLILPNMLWLYKHDFISLTYAMDSGTNDAFIHHPLLNHFIHPVEFILNQCGRFIPVLVMAIPLYFCERQSYEGWAANKFTQRFC